MAAMQSLFGTSRSKKDDAEHWIGISDMMSGLMMIFLFMAVAYMYYVQVERDTVREIAVAYKDTQVAIHRDLITEFGGDLGGRRERGRSRRHAVRGDLPREPPR